jgi:hypothetical protein
MRLLLLHLLLEIQGLLQGPSRRRLLAGALLLQYTRCLPPH